MPELPDVQVYLDCLQRTVVGKVLRRVRIASPFVLRSVEPSLTEVADRKVCGVERLGKRVVLALEDDYFLVVHLMIAGRFRWEERANARIPGRIGLVALDFGHGTLLLTEVSKRKRASLHLVRGTTELQRHRPPGIEPLACSEVAFREALTCERHTLKRSLTDPHLFSGIGNAYSDEILHAARLSPVRLTTSLTEDESSRFFRATRKVLTDWIARLHAQFSERFPGPGEITAFRPEFAVHGKYRQPCPICGTHVQRIRYADNETNYCPQCQNEGRLLADRGLSRLLKDDWPGTAEELEALRPPAAPAAARPSSSPGTAGRARGSGRATGSAKTRARPADR